jgi:hypothetical protein
LVDDPRAGYALTLKPLIYVDAGDEDAITLGIIPSCGADGTA